MGLFRHGGGGNKKSKQDDDLNDSSSSLPPVFSPKPENRMLLKGHNPSTRRLLVKHSSDVVRKSPGGGGVVQQSPMSSSASPMSISLSHQKRPLGDYSVDVKFGEGAIKAPPLIQKSASMTSGSCGLSEAEADELLIDDDEYIEEVIEDDDDEYIEYVIEEEIIDDLLPPRTTTIRFDEYDEQQIVLNLDQYTDSELDKSWYNRGDYDKMVSSAKKLIEKERIKELTTVTKKRAINKLLLPQSNSFNAESTRGLETWKEDGQKKIRELKERALEVIWNEQSRQWSLGVDDKEQMRHVYRKVSTPAQDQAIKRAAQDELVASEIKRQDALDNILFRKKHRLNMIAVSKALGKSIKVSKDVVEKTTKVVGKTGRVIGRTGLGVATLDKRMIKESIAPNTTKAEVSDANEKEERRPTIIRTPSQHTTLTRNLMAMNLASSTSLRYSPRRCSKRVAYSTSEKSKNNVLNFHNSTPCRLDGTSSLSFNLEDLQSPDDSFRSSGSAAAADCSSIPEAGREDSPQHDSNGDLGHVGHNGGEEDELAMSPIPKQQRKLSTNANSSPFRKSPNYDPTKILDTPRRPKIQKLKLLGLVPIPGTQVLYEADLQRQRDELRARKKGSMMPSWENGVTSGKC